jgi:4-hydroxybenzoyl-CoA reductase subunit beta
MSMACFRLERPGSVAEAVRVLGDHGAQAMIIAGGTDVVPNLQMKLFAPRVLVDVKGLRELRGIEYSPEGGLRIGALTTLTAVHESPVVREAFPVLWQAVGSIAGPLQRNMGTLGGNLCLETRCVWYNQSYFWRKALGGCLKHPMPHKDAAHAETICHVAPGGKFCWAVWSGDAAPALLALDAEIEMAGPRGLRRVALREFYKNNGMDRIALERDELLTRIYVPSHMAGRAGVYQKLRVRHSIDYPLAGVAVTLQREKGVCGDVRVALNAVNPAPRLVPEAREWLAGQKYSAELIERVAHRAIQIAKPLTTSHSTPVYRRQMVKLFTRRALEEAWTGSGPPAR